LLQRRIPVPWYVRFCEETLPNNASGTEDAAWFFNGGVVMKKVVVLGALLLTLAMALDAQARPRCRRCRGGSCCTLAVENVNDSTESMVGGK